jgi:hypothetical protein
MPLKNEWDILAFWNQGLRFLVRAKPYGQASLVCDTA